jgi:hypothetical protein
MNEQAPNPLHQAMIEAANQAQLAAANPGAANRQPFSGQAAGPQIRHTVNDWERVPSEKVIASTTIGQGEKSPVSAYEAQVKWATNRPELAEGKVKVTRTDSHGETYTHVFRNPDTARKFAALIGRQAANRALEASRRNKKAA